MMQRHAIGILETNSWGVATAGLDQMLKSANVRTIKYDLVGGIWIAVYVAGDINAVSQAVNSALSSYTDSGGVQIRGTVIPNPTPEFLELYDL
ncbi:MAG: BMC domain-containing protein [Dehalococcoidia bacterium]|jgi:microcompartment protein CcmL/EutN|nr:BMC domain-containing protein [Dehalococcoidia bacterium]MDP7469433.1 BMC domain-containing protein [Dehalococcoidia bacterium]